MMVTDTPQVQQNPLLSYVIASSNMRYIEINEREIYLRKDPQRGLVLRGELPECGPDCYANLSQMLLEYAMSCEDCRDQAATSRHLEQFGAHLGEELIAAYPSPTPDAHNIKNLKEMMAIVLHSTAVSFAVDETADQLRYDLAACPIRQASAGAGMRIWIAAAHQIFVSLCRHLVHSLAPGWKLVHPSETHSEEPLRHILIARQSS